MVFVNSKKFACESCIKGHRSSSCHHTDRPLFEIKKKGRPVSQCPKCRELRQSKKLHSKCTCNHQAEVSQPVASGSKSRRFIPIIPALPNGLKDVLEASQSSITSSPDSRQRVTSLLNPCTCRSVWNCKCNPSSSSRVTKEKEKESNTIDGLTALAQAAAIYCCDPQSPTPTASSVALGKKPLRPRSEGMTQQRQKRLKHNQPTAIYEPGPSLPPIRRPLTSTSSSGIVMPDFGFMPSMSEITSLAGSGCTCGVQCACPGCVEHRGPDHTSHDHRDCADGCGTCVDRSVELSLPDLNRIGGSPPISILDRFFARAAALPPPPLYRQAYDNTIPGGPPIAQGFPFSPVNLPKLECRNGQCSCPAGQCTCSEGDGNCCIDSTPTIREVELEVPEAVLRLANCCTTK